MKKELIFSFFAVLVLAAVLVGGCTSIGSKIIAPTVVSTPTPEIIYVTVTAEPTPQSAPTVSNKDTADITAVIADWNANGDPYVTGFVENKVGRKVTVEVTLYEFDPSKIKIATASELVELDPYGTSRFDITAVGAGDKGARGGTYRVFISNIF